MPRACNSGDTIRQAPFTIAPRPCARVEIAATRSAPRCEINFVANCDDRRVGVRLETNKKKTQLISRPPEKFSGSLVVCEESLEVGNNAALAIS
jgi:hypothetical protein